MSYISEKGVGTRPCNSFFCTSVSSFLGPWGTMTQIFVDHHKFPIISRFLERILVLETRLKFYKIYLFTVLFISVKVLY